MSRIGKKPVALPSGVKCEVSGPVIKVSGSKGALTYHAPAPISVAVESGQVVVNRPDDSRTSRALHGLARALIQNMVVGVSAGYAKTLEVYGTGYSVKLQGKQLLLNCGFMGRGVGKAAQFIIDIPDGLKVDIVTPVYRNDNEPAKFTVSGIDKQMVGQFAAEVRKIRKPEPYKGKGIRYSGEHVRRKQGKVFAGGG